MYYLYQWAVLSLRLGFAENDEIIVSNVVKNMVRRHFRFQEITVRDRIKNGFKGFENEEFVYSVTQKK
jgi:hypothetical protein